MELQKLINNFMKEKGELGLDIENLQPIQVFYLFKPYTDKCIKEAEAVMKNYTVSKSFKEQDITELPACEAIKLLDENVSNSEDCMLSNEESELSSY